MLNISLPLSGDFEAWLHLGNVQRFVRFRGCGGLGVGVQGLIFTVWVSLQGLGFKVQHLQLGSHSVGFGVSGSVPSTFMLEGS